MAAVEISQVKKCYGDYPVIHSLDLSIQSGEFMVLVGPSGCGKSTLLRMIAGLEEISSGTVSIGGEIVNDKSPRERGVAMVFQNYALYPHMTVRENMSFSLRLAGHKPDAIERRVREAAKVLGIEGHLEKKPSQLSGGQKQRVAMGRAMVRQPSVFLFDEPLSNLDAQLRVKMRSEISHLHRRLHSTAIYVTHDQVEAMTLADRIAVMYQGRLEQVGPPLEVYRSPWTKFVASFIGTPPMNLLPISAFPGSGPAGSSTFGFRPEAVALEPTGDLSLGSGKVTLVEPLGATSHVHVQLEGGPLIAEWKQGAPPPSIDTTVSISVMARDLFFFDNGDFRIKTDPS